MLRFIGLLSFLIALTAQSEPVDIKLGVASFGMKVGHAGQGLPSDNLGYALFAEAPQGPYAASRLLIYHLNEQETNLTGAETQLMWGIGLAGPGLRLYSGPTWHYERVKLPRANGDARDFYGFGWQLGAGVQYDQITLDLAAGWRDNKDYRKENRQQGLAAGQVWTSNFLLSYHF